MLPLIVAGDHEPSARHRDVDRRQPVVHVVHLAVDLVAQPVVDRQVGAHAPVVLRVEVQPRRPAVLVGAADADLRGARIAEQKISERVAGELPGEGERAARGLRILRVERQPEQIAADLEAMRAAIDQQVVVELDSCGCRARRTSSDRRSCCRRRRTTTCG